MKKEVIVLIFFSVFVFNTGCAVAPLMYAGAGAGSVIGVHWGKKSTKKNLEESYAILIEADSDSLSKLKNEVKRIVANQHYQILKEDVDVIVVERDHKFEIKIYQESYGYKLTISPPVRHRDFFIPRTTITGLMRDNQALYQDLKDGLKKKFKILS